MAYSHASPTRYDLDYYDDIIGTSTTGEQTDELNDLLKKITSPNNVFEGTTDSSNPIHVILAAGNGFILGSVLVPDIEDVVYGPMDARYNLPEISIPPPPTGTAGVNFDLGQGNPISVGATKPAESPTITTSTEEKKLI